LNVRDEIVALRRARLEREGPFQGLPRPAARAAPLTPFMARDGLICEMKRASPSKGDIQPGIDASAQAALYAAGGASNVSVLTEQDRFRGSLKDLMEAKHACPGLSFLRKDFLLDRADVEASWLCGADAVLLIASMLEADVLADLAAYAASLGMAALVELHDAADVAKARRFKPALVGINSRDLASFRIDPLLPLRVRALVDWPARVVYESGIRDAVDAAFPGSCGFEGILVGEALSRDPGGVGAMRAAFSGARPSAFWNRLVAAGGRTLAKVCGLRDMEGCQAALRAGADLIGFVFAPSPRRADAKFVRGLGRTAEDAPLRVGVLACGPSEVPEELLDLAADGYLDAFQFHADADPASFKAALADSALFRESIPFYKAERPARPRDIAPSFAFGCPRSLLDARSAKGLGGTGERLDDEVMDAAAAALPGLWLAGGLTSANVGELVRSRRPELVDASSGLERAPGVKDPELVQSFIREVRNAAIAVL
jgi:indole-3-glycerol phosphate synthase/phosphoribosylanthranilate isomerase